MDLPYSFAKDKGVLLLGQEDNCALILAKHKLKPNSVKKIQEYLGVNIKIIADRAYDFSRLFEQHYNICKTDENFKKDFETYIKNPPEKFLNYIIKSCILLNSTDIHMIKSKDFFVIKFRINSMLRTFASIDISSASALIRIIKLKANMDLGKTLNVAEGRFDFIHESVKYDLRVSMMPTVDMEKVSIRILGNLKKLYTLEDIDFDKKNELYNLLDKKSGFILVTGPTGSGKSTTIFTMMNYLNNGKRNIISIEDPVEYIIDGITQIPLKDDIHTILKFVLRQDPDVIEIGEIRDQKSASLAFDAANTGHMVISTIHTKDSLSSIARLKDLGIENFKISSMLSLVISQRLIRILCEDCKKETEVSPDILEKLKLKKDKKYYKAAGCPKCLGTGYKSQKAVFEILMFDDYLRYLIRTDSPDLKKYKMVTLKDKLIKLFDQGATTIEEISKYI